MDDLRERMLSFATADIALRDWRRPSEMSEGSLVASGVGQGALDAWMKAMAKTASTAGFVFDLVGLREDWPDLRLDDALGWMLSPSWTHAGTTFWSQRLVLSGRVRNWDALGLLDDGWRYVAAGFTVGETERLLAAGGHVSAQDLRMLAALRGVALPV
jgi:hypothetical protein